MRGLQDQHLGEEHRGPLGNQVEVGESRPSRLIVVSGHHGLQGVLDALQHLEESER